MPAFMKDELKKKDEEKLKEMQEEIKASAAEAAAKIKKTQEEINAAADEMNKACKDVAEDTKSELAAVKAELEAKEAELKAKDERVLRLQADFENFRRRTSKEKEEIGAVVTQGLLRDLLPLVDNFERAMAAEEKDGEAFKKGVEMIFKQLGEVLKNNGLEEIECEGKPFDPAFHQAVMRVENPELEDGSIAMVLQKGYMAKGRVIRPSMVQVVANS